MEFNGIRYGTVLQFSSSWRHILSLPRPDRALSIAQTARRKSLIL